MHNSETPVCTFALRAPDGDEHPLRAEVRKATKCSMRSVMKTGRLAAECT